MPATARDITLEDVQEILGRALVDAEFREALLKDPEAAFMVLGLNMSQDSINFFRALNDQTFLAAANTVENRLGGRPVIGAWL
ncbi:hypothetical protein J2Z31_002821 [Sinorhizobium kostiense]|uniref:Uncharacterized protein n=1 Tax=Sinorhizobium kostiense TaxID=76747 RepID=A0ABS4R088_9HYPH|nr:MULTISPECIES: Os1348 family NHLP clan protein [Sinorhizobium]MBP2236307.1 hypothetical protein [Sinorhizobium kostiense]PST20698.1 hypothetical protein C7U60_14810 [Mesorhizobium plurifarium]